jgi:hypothetical protein
MIQFPASPYLSLPDILTLLHHLLKINIVDLSFSPIFCFIAITLSHFNSFQKVAGVTIAPINPYI